MTNLEKAQQITEKAKSSNKFLIIPDSRVDTDSIGSALSVKWWLQKLGKKDIDIFMFADIPERMDYFPNIDQVKQKYINDVDFNSYDLIFLIDNCNWSRFLSSGWEELLTTELIGKFVNIDHHEPMDILKAIPDKTITKVDVCTAKVFYDNFLKNSEFQLDKEIGEYMYYALIGDTQIFKVMIFEDTYDFASLLLKTGISHNAIAVNFLTVAKEEMDVFAKGVEATHYYPKIKTIVLAVDGKVYADLYGSDPEVIYGNDYLEIYRESFMRRVEGYVYSIIFIWNKKKSLTRISWRIREDLADVNIFKIMESMNYDGGGHPGAGGGWLKITPEEAEKLFVQKMKEQFEKNN